MSMRIHQMFYLLAINELLHKINILTDIEKETILKKAEKQSEITPHSTLNVLDGALKILVKAGKVSWLKELRE